MISRYFDFNIYSLKSIYQESNKMIESLVTLDQRKLLMWLYIRGYQKGINVENPDLFVFDWYICFGAVIKRGKD